MVGILRQNYLIFPLFYLQLLFLLLKNSKIALVGTVFLAISPWHIYYSRFASDHLMGTFLTLLGMVFFLKMLEGKKNWALLAAIILTLSMYTYHSQRLFIPLIIIAGILINIKKFKPNLSGYIIFFSISFILTLPLIILTIFGPANTRAGMIFLSQDIDYTRYVILDHVNRGVTLNSASSAFLKPLTIFSQEAFLLFFFWLKRYLNYFQLDFLFFNGLNMTIFNVGGLGVLYLFELPLLLLGIVQLITKQIPNKTFIVSWIILGLIPASLTNNEQSAGRSLIILPMLVLIVSLGTISFFQQVIKISRPLKIHVLFVYSFLIAVSLINAYLVYAVHFPVQRGEAFMEGTKQSVLYALKNKDKYQEIVYDPIRGTITNNIVNIPYMYILFYSKYDPNIFQKEVLNFKQNQAAHFDKFTIRSIHWYEDRKKPGVLFIGSPWSLPEKDIKNEEILDRIYLSNGDLALLIVTPKPKINNSL